MSTAVGYLSGDRWLVAGDTAVVQLAGESSDAMRWWPAVRGGADAAAVIGQVYTDGVLGSHTPLVIVCVEPSNSVESTDAAESADGTVDAAPAGCRVRVLAQGDATAVVETVTGQRVSVTGVDLLTWSEVLIDGAAVVYLQCAEPMPAPAELLPMPAGVVRAGVVRWQLAEVAAPDAAAADAAAAEVVADDAESAESAGNPESVGAHSLPEDGRPAALTPLPAAPATLAAAVPGKLPPPVAPTAAASFDPDATQNVPDIDDEPGSDAGDDDADEQSEDSIRWTGEDDPAPAAESPQGSLSADNPFPSVSLPPFSPPPFVPVPTSLPPIQPIRPINGSSSAPAASAAPRGDHDGYTQLATDLPLDDQTSNPAAARPAAAVGPGPGQVYAVLCPNGHANAPHSGSCRVCGAAIPPAEPVVTQRPLLGRIRLSTGPLVDVSRRVVIGRAPSASRVSSSDLPQLVTVPSPQQDISRSHVEVRTEDWHLVVADLNSTNGTVIRAPGRPEQMLHPGQAVVVEAGWAVDLGDGVSFAVELPVELPVERPT